MPGRNIYKDYVEHSYYHIYNRGVDRQPIFLDVHDYVVFLSLLKRYPSPSSAEKQGNGVSYKTLCDQLDLIAFCLMPNHFHLFVYQKNSNAMSTPLKSVSISYSMYFNKRHRRLGPLFQSRYRASRITSDAYLQHITRYIHLNPNNYSDWQWSSLPNYSGEIHSDWVTPDRILSLFENSKEYVRFVDEYKAKRDELGNIKNELANSIA
jgi:REP element-mobilizing transposase RayT